MDRATFTLVVYDVRDDRRRARLARVLVSYGERVQYSVFECHLTERQLAACVKSVSREIDPAEDSVRLYRIPSGALERTILLGGGGLTGDPDSYLF